jgi:hypothetical protein
MNVCQSSICMAGSPNIAHLHKQCCRKDHGRAREAKCYKCCNGRSQPGRRCMCQFLRNHDLFPRLLPTTSLRTELKSCKTQQTLDRALRTRAVLFFLDRTADLLIIEWWPALERLTEAAAFAEVPFPLHSCTTRNKATRRALVHARGGYTSQNVNPNAQAPMSPTVRRMGV